MGGIHLEKAFQAVMNPPRHLLADWDQIDRRIRRATRVALFTDFDGTLTPIRSLPGEVRLSPRVRTLLASIAKKDVTVGVISGRGLADVQSRVGLRGIWYAGAHGYFLRDPAGRTSALLSSAALTRVAAVKRSLAAELNNLQGIMLEPKDATIAIHYRHAPAAACRSALAAIQRVIEQYPGLHLLSGKKVWELLPDNRTNKWTAIRRILQLDREKQSGRRVVFYLGDDSTDERVFEKMNGVSVAVGLTNQTAARYFLRSPKEVQEFLRRLCEVSP